MILILTNKDLNVPYEYILDKPLEIQFFSVTSEIFFKADFVIFRYTNDYNYVIKNRVDGVRGLISNYEANWYINKLLKAKSEKSI